MAVAKTAAFWLTETVTLNANGADGSRYTGSIDLGAYVDVGDQQAIQVEMVDAIWQRGGDYGNDVESFTAATGSVGFQLSDLNPSSLFVRADSNNLIASGALNQAAGVASHTNDFIPDIFGKDDAARVVVNDTLYVVAGVDGTGIGIADVYCTVRIKVRIVKLSTKDWIAISLQSTSSDN